MQKFSFIFDWSGTLCDDLQQALEVTNDTLEHFENPSINLKTFKQEFCIPLDPFYHKFCPGVPQKKIDAFFFEQYQKVALETKLYPYAFEMLQELSQKHSLFILSTLSQDSLEKILKHLKIHSFFKQVYGGAYNKKKFLPQILKDHQLNSFETFFAGDSPHDIETAQVSKVQSAGSTYGYKSEQDIIQSMPDYYFSSVLEMYRFFREKIDLEKIKIPMTTVGGLIVNEKDEVLLIQTKKWNLLWGTPGGKVNYGETLKDAFIREVKEESNLEVHNVQQVLFQESIECKEFYEKKHFMLYHFIGFCHTTQVRLNYESIEYQWASLENALKLKLNTPTKDLVNLVLQKSLKKWKA